MAVSVVRLTDHPHDVRVRDQAHRVRRSRAAGRVNGEGGLMASGTGTVWSACCCTPTIWTPPLAARYHRLGGVISHLSKVQSVGAAFIAAVRILAAPRCAGAWLPPGAGGGIRAADGLAERSGRGPAEPDAAISCDRFRGTGAAQPECWRSRWTASREASSRRSPSGPRSRLGSR